MKRRSERRRVWKRQQRSLRTGWWWQPAAQRAESTVIRPPEAQGEAESQVKGKGKGKGQGRSQVACNEVDLVDPRCTKFLRAAVTSMMLSLLSDASYRDIAFLLEPEKLYNSVYMFDATSRTATRATPGNLDWSIAWLLGPHHKKHIFVGERFAQLIHGGPSLAHCCGEIKMAVRIQVGAYRKELRPFYRWLREVLVQARAVPLFPLLYCTVGA